jgi:hypothetical protein
VLGVQPVFVPQRRVAEDGAEHGVAVQVDFENPNFETSFSLYKLKG